jgi:hypothetical protein
MTLFVAHFDTARDCTLQFTVTHTHTHTNTHTHTLVSTDTSSLPLLDNVFQRRIYPFLWVQELSLRPHVASHSNSPQKLNPSSYLSNPFTNQLTGKLTHPSHNISARTAWKILVLCCSAVVPYCVAAAIVIT